jgi:ABC-type multidrug transport system ATPase subunit
MGYCPQFDALFDLLTGEECLLFYARLKGLPKNDIPAIVDNALNQMDLARYKTKLSGTYSGGNKRKLSLVLAFIASPRVVFLGEAP